MKIYRVERNADMAEGRGPMVPDCYFQNREVAEEYIRDKPGVMWRKYDWLDKTLFPTGGDWRVVEVEVDEQTIAYFAPIGITLDTLKRVAIRLTDLYESSHSQQGVVSRVRAAQILKESVDDIQTILDTIN